jgi:hypothetical protein
MSESTNGVEMPMRAPLAIPDLETTTVSVADVPRSDEALVLIAITFGGKLRYRCGIEPIG